MNPCRFSELVLAASLVWAANTWAMTPQPLAAGAAPRPQTTQVDGVALQLNGAGVRRHPAGDLYAAALYLENRQTSAEAAVGDPGAKRLSVTALRALNATEIGELLSAGLTGNSGNEALADLVAEVFALGSLIAETGRLQPGDGFQIDWSPKAGTTLTVQRAGADAPATRVFASPKLMPAMMRIWLGPNPADGRLKADLLGL